MFSVVTIIGIFIQIFTAGILSVGTYTFAGRYFQTKEKSSIFLSILFFLSLICVASAVLSQIFSNLDTLSSHIISSHILTIEIITGLLALNALSVWLFYNEKFKVKSKVLPFGAAVFVLILIIFLFNSYFHFPIRQEYSASLQFYAIILTRIFWISSWIFLCLNYFIKKTNGDGKEKNLNALCAASSVSIAIGYSSGLIYGIYANELILLISLVVTLFSFSGFLLGNVIDPKDDMALSPLNYIRTRILFKLILIFVFMTILIVEATTIATITISRSSFSKIITDANREIIYSEMRIIEANSLLFVIIGIIITILVGIYFAKNIEYSIKELTDGTDAIKKGNLKHKIKTNSIDEIGRLANAFNEMTGHLMESQEHLIASEKLAALGTMAAGMAHEIKNPLVALRTFTQILPLKWDDAEFRGKFLAIVPAEIEKINKIAESLLKFGRPSKPEFKKININATLEEILELLENQFKKNNIRLTTKFTPETIINGDSGQLSQAFLNIVLNAVQAMPSGGEIIVKSDIGEVIKLGQAKTKGTPTVFVEITDNGPGIPEENLKNLFDPFYTTKESGTGMGLAITLRIIEEHAGSIKVRSQVGKGTTFLILLPQAE